MAGSPSFFIFSLFYILSAVAGEEEGLVPIDSGRGCVYDCSFCTIGRFWNRRSRELPVQRLVERKHFAPFDSQWRPDEWRQTRPDRDSDRAQREHNPCT